MGSKPRWRWAVPEFACPRCSATRLGCGRGCATLPRTGCGRAWQACNDSRPRIASNPSQIRICPQYILTDRFEVRAAALDLLRHRIHVPEPSLKRIAVEDRGRTGLMIGCVDHLLCLMDRERRSLADPDAMLGGNFTGCQR